MKKSDIFWKEEGWTTVQEADGEKHILGITCRTENGKVVEVRTRHHDGEDQPGKVLLDGENALPVEIKEFEKKFFKGKYEIR